MKPSLRHVFDAEMALARALYREGRLSQSFRHLETAHVLGQRAVIPHLQTHWWMFKIGWQRGDLREIWGQAARMVLGILGSMVGVVPTGNTGGANVGMFRRMPIEPDVAQRLKEL